MTPVQYAHVPKSCFKLCYFQILNGKSYMSAQLRAKSMTKHSTLL